MNLSMDFKNKWLLKSFQNNPVKFTVNESGMINTLRLCSRRLLPLPSETNGDLRAERNYWSVGSRKGGSDIVPSELWLRLMNYLCLVKSLALLIRQEAWNGKFISKIIKESDWQRSFDLVIRRSVTGIGKSLCLRRTGLTRSSSESREDLHWGSVQWSALFLEHKQGNISFDSG